MGWALPDERVSEARLVGGAAAAVFDPEDAVWAVSEAGSLMGLVGDLGLGFTNPVADGTGRVLAGRLDGFEVCSGPSEALLGFSSGSLSRAFVERAFV